MRLYAPLYEGDSIVRPDAAFGEPAATVNERHSSTLDFVRSNIQADAANETALDLHALEQTARHMRAAEIARLLRSAYDAVVNWLDRSEQAERDSFFAASANLADLEQRQRHWERTGCAHY
jgi:hypothetical protein